MTVITLKLEDFKNNRFELSYGTNKEALFIIQDELLANGSAGVKVNHITAVTREITQTGESINIIRHPAIIIGLGNGTVGAFSNNTALMGKRLSKDNMEQVAVTLEG